MQQLSIFEQVYDTYKSKKPLRLIELFAGYGSQALALKYMGVSFEHYRVCEWNWKSNYAYSLMHDLYQEYDTDMTKDEIIKALQGKGLSADWNKPMEDTQISRMKEEDLRHAYNAIRSTKNTIDISRTHGSDLGIEPRREREREYLMTYSFPCQDLSLAGKLGGMKEGSGTRSSMIWQVGRILTELKEEKQLPDVLIMENVPTVCGEKNKEDFNKWLNFLENLGYQSYYKILSATDYGIPQTRRRCFVISLLGEYYYDFPDGFPLKLKLKDMLEDNCSEKYYLSEKMIKYITANNDKWSGNNNRSLVNKSIASTLNTFEGNRRCDASNFIADGLPDDTDIKCLNNEPKIAIKEKTKKGYAEAHEGDGVYINRPAQKRGVVQKGKIQTIKTSVDDIGVVVKNKAIKEIIEKNDLPIGEVRNLDTYKRTTSELSQTLITTTNHQRLWDGLRIRKLTPRECFRLMGVRDKDYDKLKGKFSDIALYHMSGDSIVVNVLMAIFSQML